MFMSLKLWSLVECLLIRLEGITKCTSAMNIAFCFQLFPLSCLRYVFKLSDLLKAA